MLKMENWSSMASLPLVKYYKFQDASLEWSILITRVRAAIALKR